MAVDELGGKVEGRFKNNRLQLADADEYPSGYIRADGDTYTLWYQFSLKPHIQVVGEGILGLSKDEVQHVRPDIVVFKGRVEDADDVREGFEDKMAVIDAKVDFAEEDIEQIKSYSEAFPDYASLIVACLDRVPIRYEDELEEIGCQLVDLRPDESEEYRNAIGDFIEGEERR
ncbi:hypothetical protein AKJ62_03730 [candidate division MSBL1 archaeon SCGC-AAA259D14]|uniref:Uncharacterized protein n=1 Tax=candidate division MSBL1 archaeon SCGC-AAA259D14 TaxID=1698261 RepID=A0A133U4L5_9EURY|nr:hypothetical protein AKJ62_03730 [candidate division MSBL1 archaeon SCGC-AAA259D14]